MHGKNGVGEIIIAFVMLSALFLMVRPGSKGTSLVTAFTSGIATLIKASTGGGSWSSK